VKQVLRRPVPISADLARRLRAAAEDRPANAQLLAKPGGDPWSKSDHSRPFARVIERLQERARQEARERGADVEAIEKAGADLEEATIYALRHSSIVRQLLAGVPIRVVAAGHDTSVAMIEKNYSRFISDHADAMTRRAMLDVSEDKPAGANVTAIRAAASVA